MLVVTALFIPILLASSKFLLYLREVRKMIIYTHKSYEMGQKRMMLIEDLKCTQPYGRCFIRIFSFCPYIDPMMLVLF